MANVWLHRITGGDNALPLSSALFENGYISIGWADLSKEDYLVQMRTGWEAAFDKIFKDAGWGLPRNRRNLWRFLNEMKADDIVVVPQPGYFSVCRITDDKIYTVESIDESLLQDWNGLKITRKDGQLYNSEGDWVDLGFFRRVELLEIDIPRAGYADQAFSSRMKIRQTNANISDIRESVENAVERYHNEKPINLRTSIIEDVADKVLDRIRALQTDSKFEELVQWYLESIGGKRALIPAKNESPTEDGDADRVVFFDKIKLAIMVQVKKHTGETDAWAIEQIKAYEKNHSYDEYTTMLWVISTCDSFSSGAVQLAETAGVRLIDGKEFAQMILDAGLDGIDL